MMYSEIKEGDALAGNLAAMKVRNEIQLAHMTQIEAVSVAVWDWRHACPLFVEVQEDCHGHPLQGIESYCHTPDKHLWEEGRAKEKCKEK